jgi:hypothetical protein
MSHGSAADPGLPPVPADPAAEEAEYSTDEEDEVAARLEALGYLD